ncbi:MAG: tyrosine-type recombinase/integrase [Aliarcobacter sp.]|jgi:integrase/recombinase XerD|nr:tyrosine-type recombinase/integrase [Aliarcobacter sp.]
MKLEEVIKDFKFHCKFERNLSNKTMEAYSIDLNQFEQFKDYKSLDINEFDKHKLKDYVQSLYELDFKAKTIKRKVAVLKAFFTYLEFDEIILVSPFRKMRISIKEPTTLPQTIELKEIVKILKFLYKIKESFNDKNLYSYKVIVRDIAVIEILFSTGMRVSELCNIKLNNINLQAGIIKIKGKGDKERIIQICDNEAKKILKEYFELFSEQIKRTKCFLINRLDKQISEQSVRLMIKKYQKISGIDKHITPHMFRHSFATLLLEEGVDVRYIQHMLGHSSISTTQIYTKVNMKQQKKILNSKHPRKGLSFVVE